MGVTKVRLGLILIEAVNYYPSDWLAGWLAGWFINGSERQFGAFFQRVGIFSLAPAE